MRQANQIVELCCCDTTVDTRDDLLGDGDWVDVVRIKPIAQTRDASCDFVELNALLAPVFCGISICSAVIMKGVKTYRAS